jgi:hypothetical protein
MCVMVFKNISTGYRGPNERKFRSSTILLLLVSILLTVTTGAQALPSASDSDIRSLDCCSFSKAEDAINILEAHNATWVSIGRDILKPRVVSFASAGSYQSCIRSLPAVPASILMVVFGFACISLVRDRKVWLAALAVILWAGYAGIYVVRPLVLCFCPRACTGHYFTEIAGRFSPSDTVLQTKNNFIMPQSAIIRLLPYLIRSTFRLISASEWFICLTPAFTFQILPRGPPVIA